MDEKDHKNRARSEIDESGLLSGFLDGELDQVQCQRLCASVSAQERLQAEGARQAVRRCLKAFIRSQPVKQDDWSVWECIEEQCVPYRRGAFARLPQVKFWSKTASPVASISFVETLLRPQVAGGVFACSLCLMLVSMWNSNSGGLPATETLDEVVVASSGVGRNARATEKIKERVLSTQSIIPQTMVSSSGHSRTSRQSAPFGVLSVDSSNSTVLSFANSSDGQSRRKRRLIQTQSISPRGLKVDGAQIDWIDAQSHVEIVQANNKRRPPVIWVGSSIR